jgi:hypothetical protein
MDYPKSWKRKLADDEEREEIGRKHWTPTWWQILILLATIAGFGVFFWPRG